MNKKLMLFHMAARLYEDIKFVTEQNPTQIVDEDGTRAYNALLQKAKRYLNMGEFEDDLTEWNPRTIKYKDALVSAGQLFAMVEALTREDVASDNLAPVSSVSSFRFSPGAQAPPAPAAPAEPVQPSAPVAQMPGTPNESQNSELDSVDSELYGSGPVKRNEDGTIPFSLD